MGDVSDISRQSVCSPSATFMIYYDKFETQAASGSVATHQNPKKGRGGPLAVSICLLDIRLIASVAVRRIVSNSLVYSLCQLTSRLNGE